MFFHDFQVENLSIFESTFMSEWYSSWNSKFFEFDNMFAH